MKIRYEMNTPWPTDMKNPQCFEVVDWIKEGDIPFLPVIGMHIDCGDGDLRPVLQVYWSADDPGQVAVFFEDETPRVLSYWTSGGWLSEDVKRAAQPAKRSKAKSA